MMIGGAFGVVTNGIFLLCSGAFSESKVPGALGTTHTLKVSSGLMGFLTICKIIMSVLTYKQGKLAIAIFKPLLNEYFAAERGETQGVSMHERKSKKMQKHVYQVKKYTFCTVALMFCALPALIGFINGMVDQSIDFHYEDNAIR